MRAVVENPQVIKDYLEVERKQRVLLGLFERSKFTSVISRSFPSRTSQEMVADCRLVPSRGEECQRWDQ